MRWPRPLAVGCASVTSLLLISSAVEAMIAPTKSSLGWAVVGGLAAAFSAGLGLLITERARQAEVVGALLALVGVTLGFPAAREGLWEVLGRFPGTARSLDWLVALLAESSIWLIAAIALLLLCFPDGHLPSPRWRFASPAIVAAAAVHHAFGAVDSATYQHPPATSAPTRSAPRHAGSNRCLHVCFCQSPTRRTRGPAAGRRTPPMSTLMSTSPRKQPQPLSPKAGVIQRDLRLDATSRNHSRRNGKEGVNGSSPLEGFAEVPDWFLPLASSTA